MDLRSENFHSYKEISQIVNLSEHMVKSICSRAKKRGSPVPKYRTTWTKFAPVLKKEILKFQLKNPTASLNKIKRELASNNIQVSRSTIDLKRKKIGFKKRKLPTIPYLRPEAVVKRLEWCDSRDDEYWRHVIMCDESNLR
jgi:transposase